MRGAHSVWGQPGIARSPCTLPGYLSCGAMCTLARLVEPVHDAWLSGRRKMERERRKEKEREISLSDRVNLAGQALGSLEGWENHIIKYSTSEWIGEEHSLAPCASSQALHNVARPMELSFHTKKCASYLQAGQRDIDV